ncbi:hypothetical protein ONZ51_g9446 [Trametes cubensis]|uniref:Uncharacterized protein n=1 Tax=Trametes cubensis TaxID=1111947 RepID=A0AAD7TLA5_9APHY|nr:hypothetical protein ONZ51_g9446 [Trametes cubensis]
MSPLQAMGDYPLRVHCFASVSRFSNLSFNPPSDVDVLGFAHMGPPLEPDHAFLMCFRLSHHLLPRSPRARPGTLELRIGPARSPCTHAGRLARSESQPPAAAAEPARASSKVPKFQILATCRWRTRVAQPRSQRTFSRPLAFPSRALRVSDRVLPSSYRLSRCRPESVKGGYQPAGRSKREPRLWTLDPRSMTTTRERDSARSGPRDTRRHAKCAREARRPPRGEARVAPTAGHMATPRATVLPKPTQRARCVQIGPSSCQYRKRAIAHSS